MGYKTNYEPYRSQSLDMRQDLSSEELLYPLGDLYPHVVALQLQSEDNPWSKNFPGYPDTPQPPDLSPASGDFSIEMSCADARVLKLVFTERTFTSHLTAASEYPPV
ncbi:hypothetical protein BDV27DRAFT_147290 [Aspergillus caelatus]|uniref:Uncharacterized protein n=1 Tax=Aspergillus caelatus TaxID=61420 RepID=A0A5N6ZWV7_9EURO|nr:uncharacterized protein BDV27DRAFT_147290 [Aspergillus caelatus]KAE8362067.1 hypothetical protein BDV27DRAFT_147290 [Aspergillus caelatus]